MFYRGMPTLKRDESFSSSISPTKLILLGVGVVLFLILLLGLFGSFYSVEQNEVAGVTRGGQLISSTPVGPGYHGKLPFGIDTVHTIRISIDKLPIDGIKVKTVDNQFVQVDVNLTYYVANPFKALFQVGQMGQGGIVDKVIPFVQSRTLDVFGQVNALQIVDKKKDLEANILLAVQGAALELFGVKVEDVQITDIKYGEAFEKNVELMVQTRNQQVSSQNLVLVRENEAKIKVIVATGEADSAAATADGNKRAVIANAEAAASQVKLNADAVAYSTRQTADAQAYARKVQSEAEAKAQYIVITAQGNATAENLTLYVKAAGSPDLYASILRAQATQKWDGSVPKIELGNTDNKGQSSVMVLPSDLIK
jgi:modulator of FtsH protease HflC